MVRPLVHPCLLLALLLLAQTGRAADMPPSIAAALRQIGPVIDPPGTARLYAAAHTPADAAGIRITRDVVTGPDPRHRLDIFAPATRATALRPVLVFVHGGGFVAGNRRGPDGSPFYDNIGLWAARNGMVGVTATYRLAPASPWPAAQQDIARTIAWLQANLAAEGGRPDRLILFGHSAGAAHVAAYVAHREFHPPGGHGVAALVLLSGVYDLTTLNPAGPGERAYFGADARGYAARSSVYGLVAAGLPTLLGSAELDPPLFTAQAANLRDALCLSRRCPLSISLSRHSHMSEVYAIGTQDTALTDPLLAFLGRF